jgi:dTDP-4-amino-4,6-dideoxygalactose transaminase/predicted dehydrogenase
MTEKIMEKIGHPAANLACDFLMYGTKWHKGRRPFNSEELKLIRMALLSETLFSQEGTMIPAFEKEFAFLYGVPYAVASTSGTAAIHTALGALDLNAGDEVITAPITDMGTIAPILYQNGIPVFAEVDETYNMDPADVERKITRRTRAIIVVHLFGNPCNMDAMVNIAKQHNIPLIEDCAQAPITEYKGKYVGTIGDIGCFSFMQSKHMTTGEGGMTITSNKAYYERMKLFVDKGWARKGWGPRAYLFLAPNYRPTELVGAVGLAQLKKVRGIVKKRHELGEYMSELLSDVKGVTPAPITPGAQHSYWLYPVSVDKNIDINLLAKEILKQKIWVSAGYIGKPIYLCSEALSAKKTHGQSQCPFTCKFVETDYEYNEGLCPRTEEALKHLICLSFDESWTKEDIKRAADTIAKCVAQFMQKDFPISLTAEPSSPKISSSLASSETKTIRIGIVGCGQIGRWHLDAYRLNPKVKLIAFADTDFDKAQQFAKEVGAVPYSSHKEMIEHEALDGVSICTVPSTHREIALDLLNASVNILCEKPLAISVAEAREMVGAAEEKKLLLLTAFKFRFFEEVLKTKELLNSGSLGKILNFRLMFGGYTDKAGSWYSQKEISGGGVIIDNACHAVDLVRYLFGEVDSVSTQMRNYQNIDVEDTAKLSLSMKNGFFGTIDLSWDLPIPSKSYLEIYGQDGTIFLDSEGITYKFKTWNEWKRIPNHANVNEAFSRQTNHFAGSILNRKSTILDNEDGLKSQIVIEAAYKSAKQGRKVSVAQTG